MNRVTHKFLDKMALVDLDTGEIFILKNVKIDNAEIHTRVLTDPIGERFMNLNISIYKDENINEFKRYLQCQKLR